MTTKKKLESAQFIIASLLVMCLLASCAAMQTASPIVSSMITDPATQQAIAQEALRGAGGTLILTDGTQWVMFAESGAKCLIYDQYGTLGQNIPLSQVELYLQAVAENGTWKTVLPQAVPAGVRSAVLSGMSASAEMFGVFLILPGAIEDLLRLPVAEKGMS